MVSGDVKGLKVVIVKFYIRAFHDLKTKALEDLANGLRYLSNRMQVPSGNRSSRQSDIQGPCRSFTIYL
jgi:hypothetical protein